MPHAIGSPLIIQDVIDYVNAVHPEWVDFYLDIIPGQEPKGGLFYSYGVGFTAGVKMIYEAYYHIIMGTDFGYNPSTISRSTPDGTLTLDYLAEDIGSVPSPGVFRIFSEEFHFEPFPGFVPLFPNLAVHLETPAINVTVDPGAAKAYADNQVKALNTPTKRVLSYLYRVYYKEYIDPGTLEERDYKAYLTEVVLRSYE